MLKHQKNTIFTISTVFVLRAERNPIKITLKTIIGITVFGSRHRLAEFDRRVVLLNPNEEEVFTEYKQCAGKGCQNNGTKTLTVRYLRKVGYFCETCSKDLLHLGLAVKKEV